MSDTVAVDELQVGMFIHLDLGWMSHPFPRSSFRISAQEQITTLRELGLQRVRWAPERSELADPPSVPPSVPSSPPASASTSTSAQTFTVPEKAQPAAPRAVPEGPVADPARRAHSAACERQYVEAGRAMREAHHLLLTQPQAAREGVERLAHSLVDGIRAEGEMSIRLLGQHFGDPLAAHAVNVAVISLLLGRVFGLDDDDMNDLGVGALLHDVGTMELPDMLRHPDQQLNAVEMQAWREHVTLGVTQGKRMGLSSGALLVIGQHHEHADGSGFPLRLGAERLSVPARIVALVDRFDTLCNPGPMAQGLTPHEALSMMFAQCRNQYDTAMLNAFIRMVGVYPAGSVVQLTDDRWAMVVGVNSQRPLKPRVLVHDGAVPRDEALLLNLEAVPDLGIRRSVHPRQLPDAAFEYLQPRSRVSYFFEAPPAANDPRVSPAQVSGVS